MSKHLKYHSSQSCDESPNCRASYKKPSKFPPNVAGDWNIFLVSVVDGESISNPQTLTFSVTVTQNGRFVIFNFNQITALGVWQYNPISGWSLYFVDNLSDNNTYILTPVKLKRNLVLQMDAIAYKAGTNPNVPNQVAEVSYSTWTRTS